jgi:nucleolar GTP-binding protein
MNFQLLQGIRTSDQYLESAFKYARKMSDQHSSYKNSKVRAAIEREVIKITAINKYVQGELGAVLKKYPQISELSDVYRKLISCYIVSDDYKEALGNVTWVVQRVKHLSNIYAKKIKMAKEMNVVTRESIAYYGRISSVFKQVKKSFTKLESYRRKLKLLPDIKDGCVNVVIFGFPNVGKSTLLSNLTPAKPQIAPYAFTTKGINVGYSKIGHTKFQFFDTPGTLNRFEKMNDIERQAYILIHEIAEYIIYVFDPTDTYSVKDQEVLFNSLPNKKIITYLSKTDLADTNEVRSLNARFKTISLEELNTRLEKISIEKLKEIRT